MQKLNFAHGAALRPQTLALDPVTPPSRRTTALSGLAAQLQSVLTELLAGEAYRLGLSPHLKRDVGL
ncbi:hypothetical protein CHU95_17860 [Niveispirillum lacus]|uniref:Uncharacterized protein n=1 Tax=Niveispirillum lacus TaxID=1981099 RepID=A0A255YTX9_9PROT|nr:hypothetical protein [Niveispirillum lacus]OYQ32639.1 hypothetical protein CHU95_17860 [Niveispirillum lacus]